MDFKETLFKRTLVRAYRGGSDEDRWKMAEEVVVTKEANGYALWYQGLDTLGPRIIAWSTPFKDDLIAYAACIRVLEARDLAEAGRVNYQIPSLYDLALEPVV